jgi:hypothetical protein
VNKQSSDYAHKIMERLGTYRDGKSKDSDTRREQDCSTESTIDPNSQGAVARESEGVADQYVRAIGTLRAGAIRRTDTITGGILRSQIETNQHLAALLKILLERVEAQGLELEALLEEHQRRINENQ